MATPTTADRKRICALIAEGYTYHETARITGFTHGQVRGVAYRDGARSGRGTGATRFKKKQKARYLALLEERIMQGRTVPEVAAEIREKSGISISNNAVRNWLEKLPETVKAKSLENAHAQYRRRNTKRHVRERRSKVLVDDI